MGDRVLVLRRRGTRPHRGFVRWLERHDPGLRARLAFHAPGPWVGLRRAALVLNWLPDPLDARPLEARLARAVERRALRRGVPVANRCDALDRGRKSVQSRLLREAGFDAPAVGPVEATPFPMVVRSDVEHSGRACLCRTRADLDAVLPGLREPVAAPFVETRGPDGLYRKYRCFLAGRRAWPRHLQISRNWLVRMASRDLAPENVEEELRYVSAPDSRQGLLDGARRALGLDVVAFDYALKPDGGVVIWEANPQPALWVEELERPEYAYQRPVLDRIFSLWREDVRERMRGGAVGG